MHTHTLSAFRAIALALLCMVALFSTVGSVFAQDEGDDAKPFLYEQKNIKLLQSPDDSTTELPPEPGIGVFFTYFNLAWPWVVGSAAGVAVLQALYGGVKMMLSGGDSGKREEGKSKIMWALAGLLMIGLSGLILETLNPLFYVQS